MSINVQIPIPKLNECQIVGVGVVVEKRENVRKYANLRSLT